MVYLEGLNGCQVPVIIILPESLSQGMTMLKGESTFLQVDLSQSATKDQEPKTPSLGGGLSPTPAGSPTWAFPPKVEGQISMTMEVSELLSQTVLDTSGIASWKFHSKKDQAPWPWPHCYLLSQRTSSKPMDPSSQVSTPEDMEMDDPTLEEVHVSLPPLVKTLGPSREAPSVDVAQLQEEANKALGCLLATRSSLDARQRRQVSDFGMALHWIESEATEASQGSKGPLCSHHPGYAETCWMVLISKAEVWHATCLKEIEDMTAPLPLAEVENHCSTTIREAESSSTSKAHSTQQVHTKDIQCLEAEAIEEEGKNHLTFLTACSAALRASPPEGLWHNGYPIPPITRKCSYIYPVEHSPRGYPLLNRSVCPTWAPPFSAPTVTGPSAPGQTVAAPLA